MKSKLLLLLLFFISPGVFAQMSDETDRIASLEAKGAVSNRIAFSQADYQSYNIVYSRCNWTIDPAINFIQGCVTPYFIPEQSGQSIINFDCASVLTVDSIMYHSQNLTFSRTGDILTINFPAAVLNGSLDSLSIFYQGSPAPTGNGSFTQDFHSGVPIIWTLSEPYGARDWWPCRQYVPDKIDSMDIFCNIPIGNRCGSNGKLMSVDTLSSNCIYHWKTSYPIAPYLVAIAVTNYEELSDEVILQSGDTMPILNYVYPENIAASSDGLSVTPELVLYFDSLFTTYPFSKEKYGHAEFGWGGGMEHQTMTFLGSFGFEIVAHELAHQWFGDKLTCGSWEDIWLNEGFATFVSSLAIERFNPTELYSWKYAALKSIVSQDAGTVICDDTTSLSRIFDGRLSYRKGSYVLEMLRWKLGDVVFFQALRDYLLNANVAYSYATTPDLKSALEAASGISLTQFFDEWVYREGFPEYRIEWSGGGTNINLTIEQSTSDQSVSFFHIPVEVQLGNSLRDTTIRLEPDFSGEQFQLSLNFVPDYVLFDPNLKIISGKNTVIYISPSGTLNEMLDVYPNPVHDEITFFSKRPQLNPDKVDFIDSFGRLVFSHGLSSLTKETLSINQLPSGVYVAKISTAEGYIFKKIILEK